MQTSVSLSVLKQKAMPREQGVGSNKSLTKPIPIFPFKDFLIETFIQSRITNPKSQRRTDLTMMEDERITVICVDFGMTGSGISLLLCCEQNANLSSVQVERQYFLSGVVPTRRCEDSDKSGIRLREQRWTAGGVGV
jgi:hypothetical protein